MFLLIQLVFFTFFVKPTFPQTLPTTMTGLLSPEYPLSDPEPSFKGEWIHSVIFEPKPNVKLTRSSYKITSYVDFAPYLQLFINMQKYIIQFKSDLSNPTYIFPLGGPVAKTFDAKRFSKNVTDVFQF